LGSEAEAHKTARKEVLKAMKVADKAKKPPVEQLFVDVYDVNQRSLCCHTSLDLLLLLLLLLLLFCRSCRLICSVSRTSFARIWRNTPTSTTHRRIRIRAPGSRALARAEQTKQSIELPNKFVVRC
jgi:hypothetical protein